MSLGLIGPRELARLLDLPEPTAEQARVISAPLAPMAVVAGAGSGKSETMAARVVWLVANGLVRPERVLGLTFTRKAAAELAARVRRRLDQLRERLADDELARLGGESLFDGEPTVSTYHAYAARLFGDHALREALEPTMRLISPAVAWQLASRVVDAYDGPMDQVDWAPDTVTKAVMDLAGDLAEHLRTADDVRAVGRWLEERYAALDGRSLAPQRAILAKQAVREQLLPLVEAYAKAKRQREVLDHGDQMALAARIAFRHPEVGAVERSRYPVVLLDEYQDTSHAQLTLLRSLYGPVHGTGGHPVTAVGDPCQSIYGWRGASAGNLLRFAHDFPLPPPPANPAAPATPAPVERLSVSFRNGERILEAAARVQQELRAEARTVPRLYSGENRRGRGGVECALFLTVEDEAERIAQRIGHLLARGTELAPDGLPWPEGDGHQAEGLRCSDIAVLARKRAQFAAIRQALEARNIPVEVVGLGGLLTVPEVQDVVATLKVMHDPTAGASLARLLTGPRWRLGPRDLVALGRRARELAREAARDIAPPPAGTADPASAAAPASTGRDLAADAGAYGEIAAERPGNGGGPEPDPLRQLLGELNQETGSLVDALDDMGEPARYSPEGYQRLRRLRDELRMLRGHVGLPLPDLVTEVERTLGLDIEVAARSGLDPVTARADLDAFIDAAADFAGDAEDPTLGAFLAFLKAAESEEFGLEAGRVGETNSVKLLTVHASKGLEWPVVIVPGLASIPQKNGAPAKGSIFPSPPQNATRWTANPRLLPFPLRGDRDDLPRLGGLDKDDLAAFDRACSERDVREERRLAYVAVTRASYLLVATGYWWGSASRPLGPSPFLEEIREACLAGAGPVPVWTEAPAEDAQNPLLAEPDAATWPEQPGPQAGPAGPAAGPSGPPRDPGGEEEPHRNGAVGAARRAGAGAGGGGGGGAVPRPPAAGGRGRSKAHDAAARAAAERHAAIVEGARMVDDAMTGRIVPWAGTRDLAEQDLGRLSAWARDVELLLAERDRGRGGAGPIVELPAHLSVSSLVALSRDAEALARQIRRPMPRPPAPYARRGTAFHRWLESRWGQQRLIGPDDLPGAADEDAVDDAYLEGLKERFEESVWASREPLDVEVPFEMVIGDRLIRGRMDAVFRSAAGGDGDGGGGGGGCDGYEVVDWKTGAPPPAEEAAHVAVQLAAYRLAWAGLMNVPIEAVSAAFHYVSANVTLRPADLLDEAGLAGLLDRIPRA